MGALKLEHAVAYMIEVLKEDEFEIVDKAPSAEGYRTMIDQIHDDTTAVYCVGEAAAEVTGLSDVVLKVRTRLGHPFLVFRHDLKQGWFEDLLDEWLDELLVQTGELENIEHSVRAATEGDVCVITAGKDIESNATCRLFIGARAIDWALSKHRNSFDGDLTPNVDALTQGVLLSQDNALVVSVKTSSRELRHWLQVHSPCTSKGGSVELFAATV
jgi:hypothetical protein